VKVSAPAAPEKAQLGMTANVLFNPSADSSLVLLPLSALAGDRTQPAVWIVDPMTSKVKLRPVTVGQFREDGVTVTSGLNVGDIVVTAGVHKLRSDQVVRVTDAAPAGNTQARN
jgi:multidrug efflux pump subunit AcrA (membrane-fusion protein)